MRFLPTILLFLLILSACASIGRPEGGARDETPPEFVRASPPQGATGVDRQHIDIFFNENVQLEDAFNKVVVSPVQKENAVVSANGHRVRVQIKDTLLPNTTYTIDFGDAIKDLNEGNVLDGFTYEFTTGDTIDSMRISGYVLYGADLEPAQGVLVGAYSNLSDTAIRTLPPDRIARTNQRGHFTIRNLPTGTYRVYAIDDVNRDWHWDRSENVAFLDEVVVPTSEEIGVVDTLYAADGSDSTRVRTGTMFLPRDVLLSFFNENYKAQYLKDYSRPDRRRAVVVLGAPADSLPEVRIVSGPSDTTLIGRPWQDWGVAQYRESLDSMTVWITDSTVLATDSLRLSVRYFKPDSLDRPVPTVDTLRFFYREPKRSKKEIEADTLPKKYDVLKVEAGSGSQDVYKQLDITFDQPIASIDTAAVRIELKKDTLWLPTDPVVIVPDTVEPALKRYIPRQWTPGSTYRITIDSAAIISVYGEHNPPIKREFKVKDLSEYSNLKVKLAQKEDSNLWVVLLDNSDKPLRSMKAVNGIADFRYLEPGTVYLRAFVDANGDGKWTTGILDSVQPEEVSYYPKKIILKANWDIEQDWDIYVTAVDEQKPYALLRNKPKLKRGEQAPVDPDEEQETDDFLGGNRGYGNQNGNSGNGSNRGQSGFGGMNRLQQVGNAIRR